MCIVLSAQDQVAFEISPNGAPVANVKSSMEKNTAALLTAINVAESTGQDLNFNGISITDFAANSLAMFWGNVHFRVVDDDIVEHCNTNRGRNGIRNYRFLPEILMWMLLQVRLFWTIEHVIFHLMKFMVSVPNDSIRLWMSW